MTLSPGPHDLATDAYILKPDLTGIVKAQGPNFFQELDTDFESFHGHVLVMRYSFDEAWPTWEVHPHGDEMVYLLEGDTDFILWRDGREESVRVNQPGSYVCVPKGIWHTARPHAPTSMLFITPGEGTLNEAQPPQ